ncbi:unnamed protein product [Caenorhabditis angaria]|uniref:Uncharacterized protein n=1 Tax=Caenorhabditis angaria TaxID=860376 RepID=A0A9P1J5T7_9PELO|nr:unnamed protein product [Caenorhabditis angaria]
MRILFSLIWILPCFADVEFLLAVWRHGDRAPESLPYPNDPYNITFWPRGWNQLTNVGIEQSVKLGTFLRRRYKTSVLQKFDRKQVLIRSSDADRAIETAQSVVTSIFPPIGEQAWNTGKYRYWQPIPVRTNPKSDDMMLRPSKIHCPAYNRLIDEEKREIEEDVDWKYRRELDAISHYINHTVRYSNIKDVYNILLEHYNGLPFPDWILREVNGRPLLDTIVEIRRISRLQKFDSREKSKYMAGFLINNWIESLTDVANRKSSKKALLYSSHDGTLSSLLYGLNISNHQLVPYTACVMLELHTGNKIKIFLRNSTSEDPNDVHQLLIPGCSEECPLHVFRSLVADVRVKSQHELEKICSSSISKPTIFSSIILLLIFYLL